MTGENTPFLVLKRMLGHSLKIPPLKKMKLPQKKTKKQTNKLGIKPMIENVQDELYQLENKQAKGAKLRANIRWELEDEKCSKTLFKVPER